MGLQKEHIKLNAFVSWGDTLFIVSNDVIDADGLYKFVAIAERYDGKEHAINPPREMKVHQASALVEQGELFACPRHLALMEFFTPDATCKAC